MKKIYRYFRLFLRYKGTAVDVIALLWRLIVRLVSSFSFKKFDLQANIGMQKPEHLGYTIGFIEALKAFFKNKKVAVKINPDYCAENYIYAEMDFVVKFHIFSFIKNMMMLCYEAMWKPNLRRTITREAVAAIKKYFSKK